MSDTYFDELIAHLRSHTESLKELQAPDLATCLKIASEQDNAQKKHWLTLVKMQGRFSLEQQQELQGLMFSRHQSQVKKFKLGESVVRGSAGNWTPTKNALLRPSLFSPLPKAKYKEPKTRCSHLGIR